MKILVYEHVTGGGYAGSPLPLDLAAQGYAMVETALQGLGELPAHHVVVLHDARFPAGAFPAHECIPVAPGTLHDQFAHAADEADAALVIAPESDGVLAALTAAVEERGRLVLGSSSGAIRIAGDKLAAGLALAQGGVRIPRTVEVPLQGDPIPWISSLRFPLVLKPASGAGGNGSSLVRDPTWVPPALERVRQVAPSAGRCLAQEFVEGTSASVSLITDGRRVLPLTLNRQAIEATDGFAYAGGEVPFDHPQRQAAFAEAERACAAVPGLRGYVGVDVVLGTDGPVVIEINPRWTTSCVGTRRAVTLNLAHAVIDACAGGRLPHAVEVGRRVRFTIRGLRRRLRRVLDAAPAGRGAGQ